MQNVISGEEQAAIRAILTFPIIQAAVGDELGRLGIHPGPDLFPPGGIQSDDGIIFSENEERPVDGERVERILVFVSSRERPGDLKTVYVGSIYLPQRRVLR